MARENQGLQIALIAFVMLAIILGVTTFIFYRQYDEANIKAAAAVKEKGDADQAKAKVEGENNQLKTLIGFAATDQMDVVSKTSTDELTTFGRGEYKGDKTYRAMLAYQNQTIHTLNADKTSLAAANDDLNKQLKGREAIAQAKVVKAEAETKDRAAEYQKEQAKLTQEVAKTNTEKDDLASKIDAAAKEQAAAVAALRGKLDEANKRIVLIAGVARDKDKELEKVLKPTFEVADGKITWVSQRDGVVWIDIGQADALNKLTTFAVYAANTSNVVNAEKKASIEVTDLVGAHLAKARILEDKVADPIVPGDVIHTPVWAPGQKNHFALIGVIDLDNDGRSDLQRVLSLIRMGGGVVDAYQDESGARVGRITTGTTYLVKGKEPSVGVEKAKDPSSEKAWVENFSNMEKEAEKNLVKKMTLQDMLTRMGWKDQGQLVQYGRGAPADQFKPKLPEGGQVKSTGTVTPLFKPREPPRSGAVGAY